ncbi:DUF2071 domain-containing protein [bacterium]|nr:MAG: DUF2071 domain-containing protein [bacterium]
MYQRWRSLLFLHFPCDPAEIARLLPPGLEVDTFPDASGEPKAWVGLVPFRMEGVRYRFLPAVPGLGAFPETNVRTYVHRKGKEPGVWFFSLDAANRLACEIARRFFNLPYHEATMTVTEKNDRRRYASRRGSDGTAHEIEAEFGERLPDAEPGTLEFFLLERYLLYAYREGSLFTGRVFHTPYPLRRAEAISLGEGLVQAAGIESRPFVHALASDGVDVMIYPLRRIAAPEDGTTETS